MEKIEKGICFLCGLETRYLEVGIAFGSGGYDYCFCKKCLVSINADGLFGKLARDAGLLYPLKPKKQ